jgi:hypothetical protein
MNHIRIDIWLGRPPESIDQIVTVSRAADTEPSENPPVPLPGTRLVRQFFRELLRYDAGFAVASAGAGLSSRGQNHAAAITPSAMTPSTTKTMVKPPVASWT